MTDDDWKLPPEMSGQFERIGHEFLAEFLEVERGMRPDNLEALVELGHVYTKLGRYEDGLKVDETLVGLLPADPTVHYNLACSQALLGHRLEAILTLEESVRLGFDDLELLTGDSDLESLHDDSAFRAIVTLLGG